MELPNWEQRHPSIAAMVNPALITATVAAAANRFQTVSSSDMPWELSFLIVPMALHQDTRAAIPSRRDSHLPKWVERHPVIHAGLAPRARAMAPFVREGLRYGLRTEQLILHPSGLLHGEPYGRLPRKNGADVPAIISAASFLGSWFGTIDDPPTVFAVLGVTP
ncbi:three component ABC system middle component [Curtobacterium sp. ISL-83]|uniref:three component ABC system middle component n=1 Tax=Curtobacterium sp. ISL-83 TaxID=2819145 RepID=UPI0035AB8AE3